MTPEVFRMERVTCREHEITLLEDFNLSIREGEIMGLTPINSFGLSAFLSLLKHNLPLYDGYVYYREELVNSWRGAGKANNRITVIQNESCLVPGLTVADNIFVLRQGFRKNIIQPGVLEKQLLPFIQEIHIKIPANTYVEKLTTFERIVIEIVKGVVAGNRLIVLNEINTLISGPELLKLHKIMKYYGENGIAFLYISPHLEDAVQICHRVALLSNGHIEKVLQEREMKWDNVLAFTREFDYLVRGYLAEKKANKLSDEVVCEVKANLRKEKPAVCFSVYRGECLVVQSLDNGIYEGIRELIEGKTSGGEGEIRILGKKVHIRKNRELAVIQELCTKTMLFPELSYVDNLCFNLDKRMKNVWIRGNIRKSIREEYKEKLGARVFDSSIEELTEREKYQLVYHRILLQKPQVVFCVQPFKGADMNHRMYIWELLEELLEKGIAVVILAMNLADTLSIADRLITIDKNRKTETYTRGEFGNIPVIAPWLYLYQEDR